MKGGESEQLKEIPAGLSVMSFEAMEVASHQADVTEIRVFTPGGLEQVVRSGHRQIRSSGGLRESGVTLDRLADLVDPRGPAGSDEFGTCCFAELKKPSSACIRILS